MHQEFARAVGRDGSKAVRVLIRRDPHPEKPHLATIDAGISVLQTDLSSAQGLDFASLEGDAAFEGLEDVVLMSGAAILRDAVGRWRTVSPGASAFACSLLEFVAVVGSAP